MAPQLGMPYQQHQQSKQLLQEDQLSPDAAWLGNIVAAGNWPSSPLRQRPQQPSWAATAVSRASQDDSWELKAFAEDVANCSDQWPPRSYTCSYCAREFRTAQALGGHMNVHRRERAYANELGLNIRSSPMTNLRPAPAPAGAASTNPALGLCLLYPVAAPSPHASLAPQNTNSNYNVLYHQFTTLFPAPPAAGALVSAQPLISLSPPLSLSVVPTSPNSRSPSLRSSSPLSKASSLSSSALSQASESTITNSSGNSDHTSRIETVDLPGIVSGASQYFEFSIAKNDKKAARSSDLEEFEEIKQECEGRVYVDLELRLGRAGM